jgi:hypothetical protein
MANGTTESINQIKVGDQIENSVSGQSGTQANTVTAVIITHTDHDFVDVTLTPVAKGGSTTQPATGPSVTGTTQALDTASNTGSATTRAAKANPAKLLKRSAGSLAAGLMTLAGGLALTSHVTSQTSATA